MNLTRLSLWQIDALGLLTCAVVGALWYSVGFHPLTEAKAARVAREAELPAREEAAFQAEKVRAAADRTLQQVRAQTEAYAIRLSGLERLTEAVAGLNQLATAQGLTCDELKPGQPTIGERFATVPITLVGTAAALDCTKFLHAVRTSHPDVGVVGFDLRGEPENPERPIRFTFNLVWYAAPPALAAPAPRK